MYFPVLMNDKDNRRSVFYSLRKKAMPYIDSVIKDKNLRKDIWIRCIALKYGFYMSFVITKLTELIKPINSRIQIHKLGIR